MSIPDRHHRLLQRLIKQAQPKSIEELQELLGSLIGAPLPEIPEAASSPEDRAFDLVDEAWESGATKGQQLARQALELWPDCIPAYEYLSVTAKSKKQRIAYVEKGVEIGQRLFGGEFREKNAGHFWHITETRPYMRCLNSLAYLSAGAGNLSKAIVIWEDILSLNSSDNQGARYSLLPALLRQRDLKSYREYRKKYPEDTAMLYFNDALADFMEEGATPSVNMRLKVASENNTYIIPLLIHNAPPAHMPDSYALHSPEEAKIYASEAWQLWREIPGALQWLKGFQPRQKRRAAAQPLTQLPMESLELLLRDPFSPVSPLQLRPDLKDEDVEHLPFMRLTRELLAGILKVQSLKLTQKGNLPRAMVQSLYGLRLFPNKYVDEGSIKLLNEDDFYELLVAHALCGIAKWIQTRKGKAGLTKKGLQMLHGSPALFYQELLKIYTQQYNWAYTERWTFGETRTGHAGWAFVMYELLRQGDTPQGDKYYAELYFQLLPQLIEQYQDSPYYSAMDKAESNLQYRFFSGFARLFGLVETVSEIRGQHNMLEELIFRRSDLAERVFGLESARE
jgi:hypothetical protein